MSTHTFMKHRFANERQRMKALPTECKDELATLDLNFSMVGARMTSNAYCGATLRARASMHVLRVFSFDFCALPVHYTGCQAVGAVQPAPELNSIPKGPPWISGTGTTSESQKPA